MESIRLSTRRVVAAVAVALALTGTAGGVASALADGQDVAGRTWNRPDKVGTVVDKVGKPGTLLAGRTWNRLPLLP